MKECLHKVIERDSDMAKKPPQERMQIRKEKTLPVLKTPSGAKATATVFSLIETAKANRLDPFKYLVYIFEKLSQDEDYDLEQLMPWTKSVADACKAAVCE